MSRNVSETFIPRNFSHSSGTVGESGVTSGMVRLDGHVQGCAQCQTALDVPSPDLSCVALLCGEGLELLGAALSPAGVAAARLAVQVAS